MNTSPTTTSPVTSHAVAEVAPKVPAYLGQLHAAVSDHFASAVDLPTFLATSGTLTADERKLIVDQALILIEQNYAHLPLKRAMHSINPVQRLKLLRQLLETGAQPTEIEFHREMTDIFTSLRDLHTNYLLPAPFNTMTAFLPFMVEDYYDNGKRKYIVSHVVPGFTHPTFGPGVEILYWNGMPIDRAVENNAQRYAGSNKDARHARGVQTLTSRVLRIAPPPDEEWVIVDYKKADGTVEQIRLDWAVNPPLPSGEEPAADANKANLASMGVDLEQELVQEMRRALFAPHVVEAARLATARIASGDSFGALESTIPTIFQARPVTTTSGTFGYLRIRSFSWQDIEGFVNEFIRLISALPQNGLIIDVRGNGGGIIMNGELILQLLTAKQIDPEPLQFLNSPLNLEICRNDDGSFGLASWVKSMEQALQTGATYSAGFSISDQELCNSIGQRYFGPVVLITDALCYSTTDIFSAGFQDHGIGPVLGADGNTGAGGANVWTQDLFLQYLNPNGVYKPLPAGSGMRVAIRRTLRVGSLAGTPVEDLGVIPDERHFMTRRDLLNDNVDLIEKAGSLLKDLPKRKLSVSVQPSSATKIKVTVASEGMTRLDFYLDGRPLASADVTASPTSVTIAGVAGSGAALEIRGYDGAALVGRYRTPI